MLWTRTHQLAHRFATTGSHLLADSPDDKGAGGSGPKQETLPLGDKEKDAELEALRAKVAAQEKAEEKAKEEAKRKKKADDDKKRLENDEAKKLLEERDAELEALRKKAEALENAQKQRLDALIAKLDDRAKAEVEIVRDGLALDKLEAFVQAKFDAEPGEAKPAPPTPTGSGKADKRAEDAMIPETKQFLDRVYAQPTARIFAEKGVKAITGKPGDDKVKFTWKGTGDQHKDVSSFVDSYSKRAVAADLLSVELAQKLVDS